MKIFRRSLAISMLLVAMAGLLAVRGKAAPARKTYLVYVGTYTTGKSKGIYTYRFDAATGQFTSLGVAAEAANPSFLAIHPSGKYLYTVNEGSEFAGKPTGAVSAFSMDRATGKLTLLNQIPSRGANPCYIALDKTGKHVMVANYTGGSVIVFPVLEDGRLGEATAFVQHQGHSVNPERQAEPHAHWINVTPDNRFAFAADLGLDEVKTYRFDSAKGALTPGHPSSAKVNPGAGPRHFAFHPNGKFAYVLNEIQSTINVFSFEPKDAALRTLQTISTLPADFSGVSTTAEIAVHPSGKFLYASNRGHDSIAVFAVDPAKGTLTLLANVPTQGKTPRNFALDPTGTFLLAANQDSDTVVVFRIDPQTGGLTPTGQTLETPTPVCIVFLPL